jgi:hypothetical protein
MTTEYTPAQIVIRDLAKKLNRDAWLRRDLNDATLIDVSILEGARPSLLNTVKRAVDLSAMTILSGSFNLAGHIGSKVEE